MSNFDIICSKDIDESLIYEERQYLTGDLSIPQVLEYIKDENVEIGISRCKGYKIENPHYHTKVSEYHLIILLLKGKQNM